VEALFGLGVFTVFGGGIASVVALAIYLSQRHQKERAAAWAAAARQLGLVYNGSTIYGQRYGQSVVVRTESRGSGDSRQTYTVVAAKLAVPFDMGLSVQRHGFFSDVFGRARDIPVGDPIFDQRYRVTADETHRVRAALTPRLRMLMLGSLGGATFHLSDHGMVVETTGNSRDPRWLVWAIEMCSRAANLLVHARDRVPVATPLVQHRVSWERYATAAGLSGMSSPLCMWGSIDGATVHAFAVRSGPLTYQLDVRVSFAQALGIGLMLKPKGLMDRVAIFFGSQDVKLDDQAFDESFVVRASDIETAAELLDVNVRNDIRQLHHDLGPISVTDEGLSVRMPYVPHDPASIPRTVHRMTGVADQLASRIRSDMVGPYR
jgi:hypothetical protein